MELELPTDLPIPDELLQNTIAGWPDDVPAPHFGIGLSERFTNYLLAQAYNSGALCLGVTADALGEGVPLTSSLFGLGLGANSLIDLARQQEAAPLAIVLRPSEPPTVAFGNGTDPNDDPNVRLSLNGLSLDFYVWSLDRYLRAMSVNLDIDAPLTLDVTDGGLQPVLPALNLNNVTIDNSGLIREDPAAIATALQELVGSLLGDFLDGALPAIDINGITAGFGLGLEIPPSMPGQGSPGVQLLQKDDERFLGIFAALSVVPPTEQDQQAARQYSHTTAILRRFDVDPAGLDYTTLTDDNRPEAIFALASTMDGPIEYGYRIDGQMWHPYEQATRLRVDDPILRFPGKHLVEIRSRRVGAPETEDPMPQRFDLVVDI
ncbi:MAG: hypothetical protein AAGA56_15130, partial [Myxococcota bacterium]